MSVSDFRYALELYRDRDGASLGQAPIAPDWSPIEEALRFRAARQGVRTSPSSPSRQRDGRPRGTVRIAPLWHSELGPPYVSGVRAVLAAADGEGEVASEFDSAWFADLARSASLQLVAAGRLEKGGTLRYFVTAFPAEPASAPATAGRIVVEEVSREPALEEEDLAALLEASSSFFPMSTSPTTLAVTSLPPDGHFAPALTERPAFAPVSLLAPEPSDPSRLHPAQVPGPWVVQADDYPVFVRSTVLADARNLSRAAGARETGGILVGHLRRDPSVPEIFAVVEALIPASKALGELTSLTFTPEAWMEVRSILDLRRRGERFLGWMHSHPVRWWECSKCPIEQRRVCSLAVDFFSQHDASLHRCVFPSAHSIALVVNQLDEREETFSFFGWRGGEVHSRGFYVLDGEPARAEALADGPMPAQQPRARSAEQRARQTLTGEPAAPRTSAATRADEVAAPRVREVVTPRVNEFQEP